MDWEISALIFGYMRLLAKSISGDKIIDEKEAIKIISYAINNVISYSDARFNYNAEL